MRKTTKIRVAAGEALRPVGELIFEARGNRQSSVFIYSQDWLNDSGAFALAPSMLLEDLRFWNSGRRDTLRDALPGPISDSAPDSWGRGIIAMARGRSLTELDYLLAVNDRTRLGALRFLDEDNRPMSRSDPPIPRFNDLNNLKEYCRAIECGDPETNEIAASIMGYAGSLGGARPKSDYNDNGVLSIAKFTSDRDNMPVVQAEAATLNLASIAGLRASRARVVLADTERPVAVIGRFDRLSGGRAHYVSAQAFLGLREAEEAFYTDIADAMREHCGGAGSITVELRELFGRILFTILVSNNDDHLKNHGFLYTGHGWRLSPAFDINPQPLRRRILEIGISPLQREQGID